MQHVKFTITAQLGDVVGSETRFLTRKDANTIIKRLLEVGLVEEPLVEPEHQDDEVGRILEAGTTVKKVSIPRIPAAPKEPKPETDRKERIDMTSPKAIRLAASAAQMLASGARQTDVVAHFKEFSQSTISRIQNGALPEGTMRAACADAWEKVNALTNPYKTPPRGISSGEDDRGDGHDTTEEVRAAVNGDEDADDPRTQMAAPEKTYPKPGDSDYVASAYPQPRKEEQGGLALPPAAETETSTERPWG